VKPKSAMSVGPRVDVIGDDANMAKVNNLVGSIGSKKGLNNVRHRRH
jgi:hypothetical protein